MLNTNLVHTLEISEAPNSYLIDTALLMNYFQRERRSLAIELAVESANSNSNSNLKTSPESTRRHINLAPLRGKTVNYYYHSPPHGSLPSRFASSASSTSRGVR